MIDSIVFNQSMVNWWFFVNHQPTFHWITRNQFWPFLGRYPMTWSHIAQAFGVLSHSTNRWGNLSFGRSCFQERASKNLYVCYRVSLGICTRSLWNDDASLICCFSVVDERSPPGSMQPPPCFSVFSRLLGRNIRTYSNQRPHQGPSTKGFSKGIGKSLGMILWIKHGFNADPNKTNQQGKFRDDGSRWWLCWLFKFWTSVWWCLVGFFCFFVRHCVLPGKPETLSFIMMYLPYFWTNTISVSHNQKYLLSCFLMLSNFVPDKKVRLHGDYKENVASAFRTDFFHMVPCWFI